MMNKNFFKMIIGLTLVAGITVFSGSVFAEADEEVGRTYINSTYGYLEGSTYGGYQASLGEKMYSSFAETTVAVPRIRAYMKVMYAKSGNTLGEETSDWKYNDDYAGTCTFEMHHFRNEETGLYDGFVNTRCVAYGTADAIVDKAYAVYTRLVY